MQATLDASALKHVTRALTCISKFGDDLTVTATASKLSLCATNSSMSAYSRFNYDAQFFSRYALTNAPVMSELEDDFQVSGQLLVKSLLSILKHRTVEKSVDRCELSIVEGAPAGERARLDEDNDNPDSDHDSLESKLIVRLHCKHGVVKTHKLLLLNATLLTAPHIPDTFNESKLTIGPRAVRDILEHFPVARGPKSDPQLEWNFSEEEVHLRGLDASLDLSIKGQLTTEAIIGAAEFEVYDIYDPPISIAFHLREFQATIAFAEGSGLPLDMRFTDPANPLFVDVAGDLIETLFVIATSQVVGQPARERERETPQPRGHKRGIEQDDEGTPRRERTGSTVPTSARKVKAMKAAVRADRVSVVREVQGQSRASSMRASMAPPSFAPPASFNQNAAGASQQSQWQSQHMPPPASPQEQRNEREPLFLPSSQVSTTHLSQSAEAAIRESGLGIEGMDADDFLVMLEGEGEEVDYVPASQAQEQEMDVSMAEAEAHSGGEKSDPDVDNFSIFDGDDEETQLGPTQDDSIRDHSNSRVFRPLFDD